MGHSYILAISLLAIKSLLIIFIYEVTNKVFCQHSHG